MTAIVYVREDEVRALPEGGVQQGIAYARDGLTVIHVHAAAPLGRAGGAPIACRLRVLPEPDFRVAVQGALSSVAPAVASPEPVVLVLAARNASLVTACAWLVRDGEPVRCDVRFVPGRSELFSRARGLLETDVLAARTVAIVGVGSGGSTIAVELAKSGVGRFVLVDPDRLELANVARHVCGIGDLGRYKTLAVRDVIHEKNPHAEVETHEIDVNADVSATARLLERADLIVGATDGPRSRSVLNQIALAYGTPALFGRAITRAAGGDVLRVRPGVGPCLACVFAQGHLRASDDEISTVAQGRRDMPAYASSTAVEAVVQPGLASDIAPISNMMARLALVELSRDTTGAIASLHADLEADLYIWANRRERTYASFAPMGFRGDRPSILRWYGVRARRDPGCPECSDAYAEDAPLELEAYVGRATLASS